MDIKQMKNNIPSETLLKGLNLIQQTGVDIEHIVKVSKHFDPHAMQKLLNHYVESGRIVNLDLNKLKIDSLPEGLRVNKLDLSGNETLLHLPAIYANVIKADASSIQSIGRGLKCKKLDLTGNKSLKHLPKIQAEEIWANFTNIQTIEEGLKCKELDLWENKGLKHLPQMEVDRLSIGSTNIETLPKGMKVKYLSLNKNKSLKHLPQMEAESIIASETNIETIGDGLICEYLDMKYNTKIKNLPKNLEVETLDLRWTLFSHLPEDKIREMIESTGGEVWKILLKDKAY